MGSSETGNGRRISNVKVKVSEKSGFMSVLNSDKEKSFNARYNLWFLMGIMIVDEEKECCDSTQKGGSL